MSTLISSKCESGVVGIDTNLLVSDIEALRARLRALKKPLLAILVTHAHPDHFNGVLGLVQDKEVPVYATAGVGRVPAESHADSYTADLQLKGHRAIVRLRIDQQGDQHAMRYTLLGNSGLRVSEVALGTMTFGTDWGWGASAGESAKQFELFAEAGGTLIDTANKYTNGTAESILGDLLVTDRDHFVVGTKYSLNVRDGDLNAGGNHRKSLVQALEASLQRLRTDHVDILWLHAWDDLTPPEEVMRALDDQVRLGKVLYLGISDTPAWVVAQMQTLAAVRGWSTFAGLQVEYSLVQREVERELIPMARGLGLGVLAWGPLGAGILSGKYANPDTPAAERRLADVDPGRLAIARAVADIADGLGLSSSVVALAWLRAQGSVIPILGARTAQQLADNLTCLDVNLPPDALARLDQASHITRGFPHDFLASADSSSVACPAS